MKREYILSISAPDRPGIINAVSAYLAENNCIITESEQHTSYRGRSLLRLRFAVSNGAPAEKRSPDALQLMFNFEPVAAKFELQWEIHQASARPKVLILVSREGHCLSDLLYRSESGNLGMELAGIVSDHEDFNSLATWKDVRYHYLPVNARNRADQETRLMSIVREERVDLVILAAYAPELSAGLRRDLFGRCIAVKTDFIPAVEGAGRHERAWELGVKLVGATAFYPLDKRDDGDEALPGEGVILEQTAGRVPPRATPAELEQAGRAQECLALAGAVKAHLERRIILDGRRAAIFQ